MWNACAETEVYQFSYGFSFIKQDIFQFDVPMSNIPLMTIIYGLNHLCPQELGF